MLVTLNSISANQEKITRAKSKNMVQLINYAATHPESITRYHASGIILHIHSNKYFLSGPGSKIRAGLYHCMSAPSANPNLLPHIPPPVNEPIHIDFTTMNNVL